ncbi:MAG: DUF559 domain-containing protein [Chloroflexota bacterium]
MNTIIRIQDDTVPLPHSCFFEWGRVGRGFRAKLWERLRNHQLAGVKFCRQYAFGNFILDFPWRRPPGRCAPRARNSL